MYGFAEIIYMPISLAILRFRLNIASYVVRQTKNIAYFVFLFAQTKHIASGELWKYFTRQKTVFTRSAITQPKVNRFG